MLQKDKDREILNYAAAIVIGAVLAIIIKRLIEGEHKRNGSDFGVALLGGTVGAGVYALSKKNVKKKESFSTSNVNEYTASTDNQPNFTHKESAKFLSKNYLIYETDSENWFFDKACQNVIAVTDNPMNQRLLLNKGFTLTNEYVYSSQKCFSISLEKIIENKISAAAGIGANINYCPYLTPVRYKKFSLNSKKINQHRKINIS